MPIDKTEFQNGKSHSQVEDSVLAFLNERKEQAFTSHEIMEGVYFHTDFSSLETMRISTFATADFCTLLRELASEGRIRTKIVGDRIYFAAGTNIATCPKCGAEVAEPRKSWKMTGRPDKKGQRLQLHVGLFKCPTHGDFRTAISKQKI